MISGLIMLRLIIALAVCITLVHCANSGDTDQNQLNKEGPDHAETQVDAQAEPDDDETECVVCNSKKDDFCDDETFDIEAEITKVNFTKNCLDYHSNTDDAAVKPPAGVKFYCTKTKITFEFGNTMEKVRYVRTCSYAPGRYGWAGCYYTANNLYSTTVCKCENEVDENGVMKKNCNSATSIASSLFMFVTAVLMLR